MYNFLHLQFAWLSFLRVTCEWQVEQIKHNIRLLYAVSRNTHGEFHVQDGTWFEYEMYLMRNLAYVVVVIALFLWFFIVENYLINSSIRFLTYKTKLKFFFCQFISFFISNNIIESSIIFQTSIRHDLK